MCILYNYVYIIILYYKIKLLFLIYLNNNNIVDLSFKTFFQFRVESIVVVCILPKHNVLGYVKYKLNALKGLSKKFHWFTFGYASGQ